MNEVSVNQRQLPDNLPDLTKFVLIGREKLNAVRAEIKAIEKVQLAAEVHEQKLQEAQEIAEAVLDAETKLGELTAKMQKSVNQYSAKDSGVRSKSDQLEDLGISEKQKQRFETLARHPETVEKAKAEARAEGRIVTRQDVLNRIVIPKAPTQSLSDIKKQARQEHIEFEQKKNDDVVSFEEIKKDRENVEMINLDTLITIRKIISSIGTVLIIPKADITSLRENLETSEKADLLSSLKNAIGILDRLEFDLGGIE